MQTDSLENSDPTCLNVTFPGCVMGDSRQFSIIQWFSKWENLIFSAVGLFYEMENNIQLVLIFKNIPRAYFHLNSGKKNDFSSLHCATDLKSCVML